MVLVVYLFVPVLTDQIWQLVTALPFAFSQLSQWLEQPASRTGLPLGGGDGPSFCALASWGRRIFGGALGLFGSMTTLAFGLMVTVFVPLYLAATQNPWWDGV